jgi:hypothetical protein
MLVGVTLSFVGLQSFYLGCLSQLFHDYSGRARTRWLRVFSYNRSVLASVLLALLGIACLVPLIAEYLSYGFSLSGEIGIRNHLAILGLLWLIAAFSNFTFTLVLHAANLSTKKLRRPQA